MNDGTYICKQNEVLETGIEMVLLFKANNLLEMRVVDVGIYTKQALEYIVFTSFAGMVCQVFEEIWIHHQAGLHSNPSDTPHILVRIPLWVSLSAHHQPICTHTCINLMFALS